MQTNTIPFIQMYVRDRRRDQGFTLIEVMVGLALSMLSMLIILQLFSVSDARKRMTTGAAEAQQTANVSVYQLGRTVRLAGAGMAQASNLWGCPIQAYRAGTQILPAAAFPTPFNTVGTTVRAIPLLIYPAAAPDGQSDIIVVIAGNSETGQAELQLVGPPKATGLSVQRSNGIKAQDLLLMTVPGTISNCQIAQVDPTFNATSAPNSLPLGTTGTNYNTAAGLAVGSYNQGSVLLNLGAAPIFTMFGINAAKSLEQFDLLKLSGTATSVIADNVFDMRARYGVVGVSGNGPITWVSPTAAGWTVAELTAGNAAALASVDRIRAIRVSMVFRSTEPVKDASPPTDYTMFPDDNPITVAIPTASQLYRYQVYDTVIPLRNLRFVPPCTAASPLPRC
jgi:type IV pilus assembly protein PilW